MRKLKVGVVGCGFISNYHIPGLLSVEEIDLVAVCDNDEEKARTTAEKYQIPTYYGDTNELFKSNNIEAVLILTPNYTHHDLAIAASRKGKHIMVQKPFARNIKECQEMITVAKESGVQLVPSFMHRFLPETIKAKELLDKGLIGGPMTVRIRNGVIASTWASWFYDPEKTGGGAIIDVGVHGIDIIRYLLGEIKEVAAFKTTSQKLRKMDSGSELLLKKEDSATVIYNISGNILGLHDISWSQKAGTKRFEAEIYGEEGTIYIRRGNYPLMIASSKTGTVDHWLIPELLNKPMGYDQHRDFALGILGICEPSLKAEDGLATIKVVEAIYESAIKREFVKIV